MLFGAVHADEGDFRRPESTHAPGRRLFSPPVVVVVVVTAVWRCVIRVEVTSVAAGYRVTGTPKRRKKKPYLNHKKKVISLFFFPSGTHLLLLPLFFVSARFSSFDSSRKPSVVSSLSNSAILLKRNRFSCLRKNAK